MVVELMGFPKLDEQKAIQEAASEGLNGMEHLIRILSHQPSHLNTDLTDVTVSKFKILISLLNRTGHARFRRAPVHHYPATTSISSVQATPSSLPPPQQQPQPLNISPAPAQPPSLTVDFTKPNNILSSTAKSMGLEFSMDSFSVSSNSSFMSSVITGDGSVSNGKQGPSIFLTPAATASG